MAVERHKQVGESFVLSQGNRHCLDAWGLVAYSNPPAGLAAPTCQPAEGSGQLGTRCGAEPVSPAAASAGCVLIAQGSSVSDRTVKPAAHGSVSLPRVVYSSLWKLGLHGLSGSQLRWKSGR
ncbi:hypothetical protein SETIT_9G513100v2 [Setaria italica]|uniref:Uncharacterized protein n=1 Tax=Setaria italica TaxID=4555 RepID=A0A368SUT3_SETIT|nr:hypothetical protein SETIT_9G513100v2 [Setaria italica]